MALQAYQLVTPWDGDACGVVVVDTCSGVPLPISTNALLDVDDAHAFVTWAELSSNVELRLDVPRLRAALAEWSTLRTCEPCPECGDRVSLSIERVPSGGCAVACSCDFGGRVIGVGATVAAACSDWNDLAREAAA